MGAVRVHDDAQLRDECQHVPRRPAEREDDDDRDQYLGRLLHAASARHRGLEAALAEPGPDAVVEAAGDGQRHDELEDEGEDTVKLACCVVRPLLDAVGARDAKLWVEDDVLRRVDGDRYGDCNR